MRALLRAGRLPRPPALPSPRRTSTTPSPMRETTPSKTSTPAPPAAASPYLHDSLPRTPTLSSLGVLRALDYVGTVSFAHSGAILAATSGFDLLGATIVGTTTALGGGTLRDALILSKRPFWTEEPEYLTLALAVSSAAFLLWPPAAPTDTPALIAADAVGVGAFCVIGAQNGLRAVVPPLVCVVCGVATATFGGAVRDVLCRRDVRILHSHAELYATTAAAGAATYLAVRRVGGSAAARVAAGVGVAVAARGLSVAMDLRLPVWERVVPDGVPADDGRAGKRA